ncbi:PilZ domain-containing protein [Paramagnetospirillum kuznetsovii]|uniref:PilZ domain-containing protein n=1 Tax=Paramagnetospirillum kuznetsovii TaxID=2053833 RepID=A0A364NUM0_9PROT|nr:PilZ domain-containing protein [Paramagnetospirillum kuznetsovii]RAU20587.1 PilZ domain-containing protein [Paramagnetospirillum kuznetsovii]
MPEQAETSGKDRRRYPRFHGSGLMVNIGGKLVKVAGISAGGMKLESGFKVADGPMRFTLYPSKDGKVDINHGVGGLCVLVRYEGEFIAMRFDPATYPLIKFAAECTIPDSD